jgi:hypothetical protein
LETHRVWEGNEGGRESEGGRGTESGKGGMGGKGDEGGRCRTGGRGSDSEEEEATSRGTSAASRAETESYPDPGELMTAAAVSGRDDHVGGWSDDHVGGWSL